MLQYLIAPATSDYFVKLRYFWLVLGGISLIHAVGFGLIILAFIDPQYESAKRAFFKEDGIVEWLTVIGFAVGFCVAVRNVFFFRSQQLQSRSWVMAALAMGALFAMGEEISWGQRIIGFETPHIIANYNLQGETNIHNLQFGGIKINWLVFALMLEGSLAIYMFLLPELYKQSDWWREKMNALGLPLPQFILAIYLLVLGIIATYEPTHGPWELMELTYGWFFALILLFPLNAEIYKKAPAPSESS